MSQETIRVERKGVVARITLARPEIRNAFNDVMIRELQESFEAIDQDQEIRAVVLAAEGSAFCAGADLHWMKKVVDYSYEENYQDSLELAKMLRLIHDCRKPVIGRINGPAIGGGTGLVAVTDIAVAAESALFSFAEVRVGVVPACISPYVVRRLGQGRANALFLTGERFSADEALRVGLVNKVVPDEDLDTAIERCLRHILASAPGALETCKAMLEEAARLSLDESQPRLVETIARRRMSDEGQEGMNAFLERRKPSWCLEHP